jgi:energy-coupling factor transport system ATP-binding protein
VKPIIVVKNLCFAYQNPGEEIFPVLKGISFEIKKGELVALVGANGSGKTTCARHMNGLLLPTSGEVLVNGLDTREPTALNAIRARVGMVFQFPEDQIVATSVEDDVAFGLENEGLPTHQIARRVKAALQEMDLWRHRTRPPYLLSGGQMQRLALAGILAREPDVILMDEPTVMLDPAGKRATWEQIEHLREKGKTILLITHDMDEAARAERVLVLHEGKLVFSGIPNELFSGKRNLNKFKLEMPLVIQIGNDVNRIFGKKIFSGFVLDKLRNSIPRYKGTLIIPSATDSQKTVNRKPVVIANDVSHTYMQGTPFETRALCGVTFYIPKGSIHGLIGATGSGKSTLLQHLNGLYCPQRGTMSVASLDLNDPTLRLSTVCRKVGLAFQNPENQFFHTYVGDEIAYAARQLDLPGNLAHRVKTVMEQVGLDFKQFKDRPLATLSGGERRKVSLASILVMEPEVLVLDEPTAGLDPLARRELLKLIRSWRTKDRTIILSSQNMEDIAEVADSVTVLHDGKVVLHGTVADVFTRVGEMQNAGLQVPAVSRVSAWLREKGWPIPVETVRLDQLRRSLKRVAIG